MRFSKKSGDWRVVPNWKRWFFPVLLFLLTACQTAQPTAVMEETPTVAGDRALGVEVVAFRESAGGYMLDFRFRVVDNVKAAPLNDRRIKPYIIHEATGAKFVIPSSGKVGPLRQTVRNGPFPEGRVYFMMFANPGNYIKPGDLVTIVVGDQLIEHIPIE